MVTKVIKKNGMLNDFNGEKVKVEVIATFEDNGKNYAINNEDSYKNLIEEVIVHNKLLQDIISYIDKDTSTAESTTPTTESLI